MTLKTETLLMEKILAAGENKWNFFEMLVFVQTEMKKRKIDPMYGQWKNPLDSTERLHSMRYEGNYLHMEIYAQNCEFELCLFDDNSDILKYFHIRYGWGEDLHKNPDIQEC